MFPEAAKQLGAQQPTISDSRLHLQHTDGGGEAAPGERACEG